MKKVIYLLGIMLLMVGAAKAQDSKAAIGPEIEFEKVVHDYGDVPFNGNGECEFRFTNTGNEPLLIGGLATGFVLAVFMANSGGAWDNAKKYVEEGRAYPSR